MCAGSTELWEWDNVSMDEANALHDKIMRGHLRDFFGFEVSTEGDAFLLAFHDPVDAVKWCIAVQQVRQSVIKVLGVGAGRLVSQSNCHWHPFQAALHGTGTGLAPICTITLHPPPRHHAAACE